MLDHIRSMIFLIATSAPMAVAAENMVKNPDFDDHFSPEWTITSTDAYSYAAQGMYYGWPFTPNDPLVLSGSLQLVAGGDANRDYSEISASQCVEIPSQSIEVSMEVFPQENPTPAIIDATIYSTGDCSGSPISTIPITSVFPVQTQAWNLYAIYNKNLPADAGSTLINIKLYTHGPWGPMPIYYIDHVFLATVEQIFSANFD